MARGPRSRLTPLSALGKKGSLKTKYGDIGLPDIIKYFGDGEDGGGEVCEGKLTRSDLGVRYYGGFHYPPQLEIEETVGDRDQSLEFTILGDEGEQLLKALSLDNPGSEVQAGFDIVVLRRAHALLFNRPAALAKMLVDARKKVGPSIPIYAPGCGYPHLVPFLYALGVDLFDDVAAYRYKDRQLHPLLGMRGGKGSNTENIEALEQALSLSVSTAEEGDVHRLLEPLAEATPEANLILRIWYGELYDKAESYYSVSPTVSMTRTISPLSLQRPDIRRWQMWLRQRYAPPCLPVLLLLPCSARKPYSESRTHRGIRNLLTGVDPGPVHEVVVTSPLGLVPMELERAYPAAHYDTPVTGQWSLEEEDIVVKCLRPLLDKGDYRKAVAYPGILDPIPAARKLLEYKFDKDFVYPSDRSGFKEEVGSSVEGIEDYAGGHLSRQISILSFQFGPELASEVDEVAGYGEHRGQPMIYVKGRRFGSYSPERGIYALSLDGADFLLSTGGEKLQNVVDIDTGFDIKGSVLAPGIIKASKEIRPGEDVIVLREGKVTAVGIAEMSGSDMELGDYGVGVKVREHR